MSVVVTEVVDMVRGGVYGEGDRGSKVRKGIARQCLANAAVGSPTVNLLTELVGNASISTCSSCSIIPLQTVKCAA